MPQLNGTGPTGQGSGTGRRRGKCQPSDKRNEATLGSRKGLRRSGSQKNNFGFGLKFRSGNK